IGLYRQVQGAVHKRAIAGSRVDLVGTQADGPVTCGLAEGGSGESAEEGGRGDQGGAGLHGCLVSWRGNRDSLRLPPTPVLEPDQYGRERIHVVAAGQPRRRRWAKIAVFHPRPSGALQWRSRLVSTVSAASDATSCVRPSRISATTSKWSRSTTCWSRTTWPTCCSTIPCTAASRATSRSRAATSSSTAGRSA